MASKYYWKKWSFILIQQSFCLTSNSQGVSFNKTIEELKSNFKKVDNFITEENVKSPFKYEFIPTKTDSPVTNLFVYDLETHYTDQAGPFAISFCRLSKVAAKNIRDLTPFEIEKYRKKTLLYLMEKVAFLER